MKSFLFWQAALVAATLAMPAAATPAFAQATLDGASIFGAWKPYITEILAGLVAVIAGWVLKLVRDKLGLDIDARHREVLQTALTNAAGLVVNSLGGAASAVRLDVRSPALAEAVTYVLKGAPDALAHFGLSAERVREMVMAKAGLVQSGQSGAT